MAGGDGMRMAMFGWFKIKRSSSTWGAALLGLAFFVGVFGLRALIETVTLSVGLSNWAEWLFAFTLVVLIAFPAMYGAMSKEPLWRRLLVAGVASGVISFIICLPWLF